MKPHKQRRKQPFADIFTPKPIEVQDWELVANEPCFPEEWYARQRAAPTPEERLMLAVLADAALCAAGHRPQRKGNGVKYHGTDLSEPWRAKLWINTHNEKWPFSFINICYHFGLDPGAVRASIKAMRVRVGRGFRLVASSETAQAQKRKQARLRDRRRDRRIKLPIMGRAA